MKILTCCFVIFLFGCHQKTETPSDIRPLIDSVSLVILGNVQDGGSPHIGCQKNCCKLLFENPDPRRKVVSLGLVDSKAHKTFLIEASPDMPEQMKALNTMVNFDHGEVPDGIFITHAHIGHYTGLMYLGRESLGAKDVPIYVMPTMKKFLETNGPWDQLVNIKNIILNTLVNNQIENVTKDLSIQPFLVPHRDEYSETVGFKINGPNKSALFIPDIDKWNKWDRSIVEEIRKVDFAFIDATFYDGVEINNRDIAEIPHPFVIESMNLFDSLPNSEKSKIHFIHLNHTNPLLDKSSQQYKSVIQKGYNVANFKKVIIL